MVFRVILSNGLGDETMRQQYWAAKDELQFSRLLLYCCFGGLVGMFFFQTQSDHKRNASRRF